MNSIEINLPRLRVTGMTWAVAFFSLAGLIASMLMLGSMEHGDTPPAVRLLVFVACLTFVGGISGGLIWQLMRIVNTYQEAARLTMQRARQEIGSVVQQGSQHALPPPQTAPAHSSVGSPASIPASQGSVSEHTTRSLSP
ncbi:MAG: hypothetical protein ACKV2V_14470 [Blastocatellia bacterium]